VVQQLDNLDPLLAPIDERFGKDKRKQVAALLHLQAQLGLKRKVQEMTPAPKLRAEMGTQVAALRQEIDTMRQALGVYCMAIEESREGRRVSMARIVKEIEVGGKRLDGPRLLTCKRMPTLG